MKNMYMMIMNFKKLFLKMYFEQNNKNKLISREDIKLLVME